MLITDKSCDLCGNIVYFSKYIKNNFEIVACLKCSLVKTVLPYNFDLSAIYNKSYFQGGQSDGYADYIGSEKVLKREFKKIVNKLLKFKDNGNGSNLLEIGCAYGFFLEIAKEHFICSGIEVSAEAAINAQKTCENIFCGTVTPETLNVIGEINFVVMLDVIEHLANPSNTLKSIAGNMPQGGILLLTTGNINSLYAKITGRNWRLMTPPQHISFFSDHTIRNLLEKHNFEIVEISTPFKTVPIGLILYQLTRKFNIKLPKYLVKLLSKMFLPVNLFDTIQVIARKR